MHIDIDILVYALIAAVLLGRLWAILGSRSEDETQRANPFVAPQLNTQEAPSVALRMAPPPLPPASLEGALAQVKAVDSAFNEKSFLQNARTIFSAVVPAYAAGNLDSVALYLSPALLMHFRQAAQARTADGQTAQTRIARIQEAEVIGARAEGTQAYVTVRFMSNQENILRDRHGTIIGGAEGKIEEVTDIWVFSRSAQPPEAQWLVVETRG